MIGYKYFDYNDMRWRDNQGGLFPLSPPNTFPFLGENEVRRTLNGCHAIFVRWESDFDCLKELPWWHVIKESYEELSDLPKKTRYMIRKASQQYETRQATRSEVIKEGFPVYKYAFERYQTHEPIYSVEEFRDSVEKLPDETEFWAVFERRTQKMVAFSENYVESGVCFYVTMWLEPESMKKFSGYLLFHEMELHYLRDRKFRYISDGARSLSHDTSIHDFLVKKFNFRKAYARLHVVYAPWLGLAVRLVYPFRQWVGAVPLGPFRKASILLKQEEIRRQCEEPAGQ